MCDVTRRRFVVATLREIEADVALLKQLFGGLNIHREEFGFDLVPANLSGLLDDIVAADFQQCLPDPLDSLAMWLLSELGRQGCLQDSNQYWVE